MPMPAGVASVATFSTAAAQAWTRIVTSATNLMPGSRNVIDAGLYEVNYALQNSGVAGSAALVFTWYDDALGSAITATANNAIGSGASATSLSGASANLAGSFTFKAGSGVSGASAYIHYAVTGNSGSQAITGNIALFRTDFWSV